MLKMIRSLEAGELSFSKTQKWCSTAQRKIRFIDETYDISSLYDERSSPEDAQSSRNVGESPNSTEEPATLVSPTNGFQAIERDNRTLPPPINEVSLNVPVLPEPLPGFHYDTPSSTGPQVVPGLQEMIEFGYYSPPDLRIPQSSYLHPFQTADRQATGAKINPLLIGQPPALQWCDKQDVALVRHFVDVIAPIFDHGGQRKSFATTMPQLATVHQPLLRAISSIAAISLNILGIPHAVDPRQLRSDSYSDLGVIASEAVEAMDDQQFYTVSFLKIFDNLDRSVDPGRSLNDPFGGMQGQQAMYLGQITLAEQLRQDMSWASLRVQLYFAVINQEPCSVLLTLGTNEYIFEHEDNDSQWARKMVLHLHNVVSYCFGDDKDGATYNELVSYAQEWAKLKPISFDPIFTGDADGDDVFPAIFLLNDAVAVGWQMYHLSRILMVAHDHNRPMLGPSGALVRRSIDKSLRKDAEIVCGIANSIGGVNPAYLAACMAISLTGHLFTKNSEQKALLDILVQTEKQFGWPTSTIQSHVRETWEC
ncbi:hypothetical protein PFICI_06082 [Pestalotiopsis fici W106-1]|uniref:Transcription factor domain-containing protein n=1 Tax=Pestalotiopsis fici (strain W106-1 / CGMCC3.15140) TaxID=1229662 RepID=W3X4U6_PESFW|nr:uncharacterized protein PFICI_06082 [Pestalotiopsis fici W106-1]ETS81080.1 hypothetical protein PFICI_06082 [Pestalotiopsis fici W106-1]